MGHPELGNQFDASSSLQPARRMSSEQVEAHFHANSGWTEGFCADWGTSSFPPGQLPGIGSLSTCWRMVLRSLDFVTLLILIVMNVLVSVRLLFPWRRAFAAPRGAHFFEPFVSRNERRHRWSSFVSLEQFWDIFLYFLTL